MMTSTNLLSDSQESALFDDATYHVIESELNGQIYPAILNEEEIEVEQKCNMMMYAPNNIPILDEFPGRYNFQMILNTQGPGKNCVYSEKLGKIFINMDHTLPLRFEWKPAVNGLWVRTTMVFSLDQYRGELVVRCHNHIAPENQSNAARPDIVKHVVRCTHPLAIYEDEGSHLSVLAPLGVPQIGTQYVPMNYQFVCKNSCTSGMNRRPTELVFTLENPSGQVLGRRRLPVRVCSCPKRDKEKEEGGETRSPGNVHVAGGKKRKLASCSKKMFVPGSGDTREYNVQFKIPGKDNYLAVMKYAFDLLAGQGIRSGQQEAMRPYMEDLLQKM